MVRTVSEIDGDFSRKLFNFPTPVYFAPQLTGLPLELGIGASVRKTGMMGLPEGRTIFKMGLAV